MAKQGAAAHTYLLSSAEGDPPLAVEDLLGGSSGVQGYE